MGEEEADCHVIMAADVEMGLIKHWKELFSESWSKKPEVGPPSQTGRGH